MKLLKKKQLWKVTFIGNFLIVFKYRNFGVATSFLLKNYNISPSTFYYNSRLFFVVKRNRKSHFKGFSLNTKGEKVSDVFIPVLSIIDAFDRSIVGVYIGHSIKAKDFINTLQKAIDFRGAIPDNLIIRTDNGPQFKAKFTAALIEELNITHEFGYKNIHCFAGIRFMALFYFYGFSKLAFLRKAVYVQREFVESIEFNNIEDVYNYYISYIYFYNNLRPHGSLKYFTPDFVFNLFNHKLNNNVSCF
ncbi:hypothetical protein XO10_01365 [Marinitoga sp. 1135]|nr:hypothetical protein [Marinitoga sp. 1135]NUU96931.1 hypothetical protein [Marinitoga sp. 1138]